MDLEQQGTDLMATAVRLLAAWASAGAGRPGAAGAAAAPAARQMRDLVEEALPAHPAIQRLLDEASPGGEVSPATRVDAAAALRGAAERDPQFESSLRSVANASAGGPGFTANVGGNLGPTLVAGAGSTNTQGDGNRVSIVTKITQRAAGNPKFTLVVLIAVLGIIVYLGIRLLSGGDGDSRSGPERMSGTWAASDGSGNKIFGDNGQCKGFYYNNGAPLDIGGPMQCSLSTDADAEGLYALSVIQSPNEASYKVRFVTDDHARVYSSEGKTLYELDRS